MLVRLHGDVRVADDRGGDEDGGSRGELNNELELPQHEMATPGMIEVTEGGNDAPAKRDVEMVNMFACHSLRPEIDRYGCEDDLRKVAFEVGVVGADRIQYGAVELVEVGREELECSWAPPSAKVAIAERGGLTISESSDPLKSWMVKERLGSVAGPLAAVRHVIGPLQYVRKFLRPMALDGRVPFARLHRIYQTP